MEDVQIIDNFLNDDELNKLIKILQFKKWSYYHSSGGYEIIDNKFFASYNEEKFFSEYIKLKLEKIIKKKVVLLRNYMHIQTYGQDGGYHIDCKSNLDSEKNNNKFLTFCLYITNLTSELLDKAGGDFYIKIPNNKYIISIKTIMNRGIVFPSLYFHKGNAYSSNFSDKRLCLTWKMEII